MKTCIAEHREGDSVEIHFQVEKQISFLGSAGACGAVLMQPHIKETNHQHSETKWKIIAILLFLCFLFCHCFNVSFTSQGIELHWLKL